MKEKIEIKDIILVILVLVMLCVNIIIYINKFELDNEEEIVVNTSEEDNLNNVVSHNTSDGEKEKSLKSMSERERMEYYFSEFMEYIENGKYQEAYDLLYPEFKDNYFKTLDDFKKYVNKTYPDFVSFSYNNIDRQGYIYVLTITVINPDVSKDEAKKSQRIVIKENDFNDFVLSFQVI